MAGSVAPMATVAGISSRSVPQNTLAHCRNADGCSPIIAGIRSLNHGIIGINANAQTPITISRITYQRPGTALARMCLSSAKAPIASPVKNAAITAKTATISWPSATASILVQTIS